MQYDGTNVEDYKEGFLLEEGNFEFEVYDVQVKNSANTGNQYLNVEFRLLDPLQGKIFQIFSMSPKPYCKHMLKQLLLATSVCECLPDQPWDFDETDMMGKVINAEVKNLKQKDTQGLEVIKSQLVKMTLLDTIKDNKKEQKKPVRHPDVINEDDDIPF